MINTNNIIVQDEIDVILKDEYDKEYLILLEEIENRLSFISKHDLIRVSSWIKKLNQITSNKEWKKNRNLYALYLLDMILNSYFEEPFNKFPPDGNIQILSKTVVKSRLSSKFEMILGSLQGRLCGNDKKKKMKSESLICDSQIDSQSQCQSQNQSQNHEELQVKVNNHSQNTRLESIKEEKKEKKEDIDENIDDNFYEMVKLELSNYSLVEKNEIINNMTKERDELIEKLINQKEVLYNIRLENELEMKKEQGKAKPKGKVKEGRFNQNLTFGKKEKKENEIINNNNTDQNRINRYRFI